ncbi:NAD(P)-dependent oxidoreductase [Jatrophihabitans fulvus]
MTPASLVGTKVGFVGAGRIGLPMIEMLTRAGASVTAYARRAEVREQVAATGAGAVASLPELGDDNQFVIACLFTDQQLSDLADDFVGVLGPGATFVSHTTGSPQWLQRFARRLDAEDRGVGVVDAAFSGTAEHIRSSSLTVMLGGAKEDVERVEPVVRAYADPVIRTGELGSAMVLKLINNAVFAANVQLALEVAGVARTAGVPLESLYEVLLSSSGGTRALAYMQDFSSPEEYGRQVIPYLTKDIATYEAVATELGLDLGLISRTARGGAIDVSGG